MFIIVRTIFAGGRPGRLVYEPFQVTQEPYDGRCAMACLEFPKTKCLGFNYNSIAGPSQCELLDQVESDGIYRHMVTAYYLYIDNLDETIDEISFSNYFEW